MRNSGEEGTVAGRFPDQIEEELKSERQAIIMETQRHVSRRHLQSLVGKTLPVLVEGLSAETELLWQGRLSTQAPEVDGVVLINDGKGVAGQIQLVTISGAHDYDLIGAINPLPVRRYRAQLEAVSTRSYS